MFAHGRGVHDAPNKARHVCKRSFKVLLYAGVEGEGVHHRLMARSVDVDGEGRAGFRKIA